MANPHPDLELRERVVCGIKRGLTYLEIANQYGVSEGLVGKVINANGGVTPKQKHRSSLRLSADEREKIAVGLHDGDSIRTIARDLGRAPSTICREVNNNGGPDDYKAWAADVAAEQLTTRPKIAKLVKCKRLRKVVQKWLNKKLSPKQISERLMIEFPDDDKMRISPEAIYQSLYIQGRGALRRELTKCLRTGRAVRKQRSRQTKAGTIKDMIMISERPAEVADRAIPGHWEGDLIVGKDNKSAIATLVERQTRYVMLAKINDQSAETLLKALKKTVHKLPEELFKSLTWDQGKEMAEHARFTLATNIDVYFCDPHSPWQRGSNENTNGLLRQYFPKGTDLSVHSQRHLNTVARELNERPRQTLGFMTPAETLDELLR